jgi:hypothetical protein
MPMEMLKLKQKTTGKLMQMAKLMQIQMQKAK